MPENIGYPYNQDLSIPRAQDLKNLTFAKQYVLKLTFTQSGTSTPPSYTFTSSDFAGTLLLNLSAGNSVAIIATEDGNYIGRFTVTQFPTSADLNEDTERTIELLAIGHISTKGSTNHQPYLLRSVLAYYNYEYRPLQGTAEPLLTYTQWDLIKNKPTTLAGYGITDAVTSVNGQTGAVTLPGLFAINATYDSANDTITTEITAEELTSYLQNGMIPYLIVFNSEGKKYIFWCTALPSDTDAKIEFASSQYDSLINPNLHLPTIALDLSQTGNLTGTIIGVV